MVLISEHYCRILFGACEQSSNIKWRLDFLRFPQCLSQCHFILHFPTLCEVNEIKQTDDGNI